MTKEAARLRTEEQPFVIATVVAFKSPQSARPGSKAIILPDGSINGWIGGGCVQPIVISEARKALQTGKPKLITISPDSAHHDWKGVQEFQMTCQGGGSLEIYLEPVQPKPELIILGNSPIAQLLCMFGSVLEFKLCVADPQAVRERFAEADALVLDLSAVRERIGPESYVVIATMGTGDEDALEAVAGTTPKYLGLVASKEKAKGLFQYLRDKGIPHEHLDRITCPAGLEFAVETLPEIALSVMAGITHLRRSSTQADAGSATHKAHAFTDKFSLPLMNNVAPAASRESSIDARDPVCGMTVDPASARYKTVFRDATLFFCCVRCKESFERSPESYLQKEAGRV
ncbi:MAG TPA: XdhC family protein [Blastocatellia bacterium]|nr:XdhC family protein [Blastocatellia bacterium]